MTSDPFIVAVCRDLVTHRGAHTILLYGSRAEGSHNEASDYDIAAFAPIDRVVRDARVVDGRFLDVFVHPERILSEATIDTLLLRGSRILLQRRDEATRFLAALDAIHAQGPEALPLDEIQARDTWARKMAKRAAGGDPESDYRRAWLLTALLEDYFVTRQMWFEGPKKGLRWLRAHRPMIADAFERALRPEASVAAIDRLVELAIDRNIDSNSTQQARGQDEASYCGRRDRGA